MASMIKVEDHFQKVFHPMDKPVYCGLFAIDPNTGWYHPVEGSTPTAVLYQDRATFGSPEYWGVDGTRGYMVLEETEGRGNSVEHYTVVFSREFGGEILTGWFRRKIGTETYVPYENEPSVFTLPAGVVAF